MRHTILASAAEIRTAVGIVCIVFLIVSAVVVCICYKRCPADKMLVVYGKFKENRDGTKQSFRCIHGGCIFVRPFVQKYTYLDLNPFRFDVDLKGAPCKDGGSLDVRCEVTAGISPEPERRDHAAEFLTGLTLGSVSGIAKDVVCGQISLAVKERSFDEIQKERDRFLEDFCAQADAEFEKLGLRLLGVSVTELLRREIGTGK